MTSARTPRLIGRPGAQHGEDLERQVVHGSLIAIVGSTLVARRAALLTERGGTIRLAPAYDLLATKLLLPGDREEMALSLNGKRDRLRRSDFVALGTRLCVAERAIHATFERFSRVRPDLVDAIETGFLSPEMKETYMALLAHRCDRLAAT